MLFDKVIPNITKTIHKRQRKDILKRLDYYRGILESNVLHYEMPQRNQSLPKKEERKVKCQKSEEINKFIKEEPVFETEEENSEISNQDVTTSRKENWNLDSEYDLSIAEQEKLVELKNVLNEDWIKISNFFQSFSPSDLETYYYNLLRWAGNEYKLDIDKKRKKLSKIFKDQDTLYLYDPMAASESELIPLEPVLKHLLSVEKDKGTPRSAVKIEQSTRFSPSKDLSSFHWTGERSSKSSTENDDY